MKDKILVFIPMYNCEKQIIRVLEQFEGRISSYVSEIILVNNQSTDHSEEVAVNKLKNMNINLPIKLLRNDQNYGLGGSHKVAFQYAVKNNFDYLIVLHGDDQGNIADLLPILENKIYEKYDCCLGSRFMKGSNLPGYSKFRTFGNYVYNLLFSIATFQKVKDLGSGLNLYKVNMLKKHFYMKYSDTLMFNCYMLLANSYFKFNVHFFPISWREDDQVSNVKLFSQAIRTFKIATGYFFSNKKNYMHRDFRDNKKIKKYVAKEIYRTTIKEV